MAEQGPTFKVGFEGDDSENTAEANRMAALLEKAFVSAFAKIGPQLARELSKSFKAAAPGKGVFSDLQAESAKFAAASATHAKRLRDEFVALEQRAEATRATLKQMGSDPRLFAVLDQSIANALSTLREFDRELAQGTATDDKFERLQQSLRETNKTAFRELGSLQSLLKSQTAATSKAAEAQRVERQQANQKALAEARIAHGRFVAEYQRETALVAAEARTSGQRLVQQERATQRARLEVMRFAFGQIRALQRGLSDAIGAGQRIIAGSLGGIAAITSRLTGIFRRSNRDLNDGLRPALLSREQSLSRSFRSQSSVVSRELRSQSVLIERFERQTQAGVLGAATGRSRLGSALGLGAGLGGGFALFQGIRTGFNVGGDFVQGLAVLEAQLKLTEDQMKAVREQSIALGNDITLPGVSALDAAQAIQILSKQFASLGPAALPNAQAAARGVLQLARATGSSAEEAARVVGAAVNVFGVAAEDAVIVADQITNALTNAAGVGFQDFALAFQQGANVVNAFIGPAQDGLATLAEYNTALALLARNGIIGQTAGDAIKNLFLQANRGTEDANAALEQIVSTAGEVGSVFFDAEGNARNLADAVDILRRGTKDLSDQARTKILQKLFGTDASRAALALIGVSRAEFERLTVANQEQGAAAEIAAAQNTGLRGALDALQSVIETQQIKTYEKYQGAIAKVVTEFTNLLSAFLEGRGIFRVIRAGLAGLAIALGALLAVKVVAEGFQLLAIAFSAVASPLGIVVAGLALLGGAIGVLSKVSPEFRRELAIIGGALRSRFLDGVDRVADGLAFISRFLRTEVLPRFVAFGVAAVRLVIPALEKVASIIKAVLLPAIGALREVWQIFVNRDFTGVGPWQEDSPVVNALFRFRDFVAAVIGGVEEIWNIFVNRDFTGAGPWEEDSAVVNALFVFRDIVARIVGEVRELFSNVFDSLPTVTPAKLIATLGVGALGALVGGPLGAAIGAAIGFAVGGLNLSGMGDRLIDALRPQLEAAIGFIREFVGRSGRLAGPVQRFLLGPFQEGAKRLGFFLGNLITDPRLIQAIEKLIGLAVLTGANFVKGFVSGATSNLPRLMTDLVGQIDSAFNAALRAAFRDPGTFAKILAAALVSTSIIRAFFGAGEAGARGMVRGFGSGLRTNIGRTPQFLTGFFGGATAIEQQGATVAKRFQASLEREFAKGNRDLARLGKIPVIATGEFGVTAQDVATQRERLNRMKANIGEVGAAGIIARQRLREGFRGISDEFTDLSAQMGGKGRAIGTVLGTGIVAGVGAALAGEQLGGATSAGGAAIGLAGVIGAALIPAFTIPGPVGLGLAGITLAVGGLAAALRLTGDSADESAPRIKAYVDILKQVETTSEAAAGLTEQVADTLLDLGPAVQGVLSQAGFNVRDFVDDAVSGQASLAGVIRDLTRGLGTDQRRVQAFVDSEIALGHSAADAIEELDKAARGRTATNQATALIADLRAGRTDADAFVDILEALFAAGGEIPAALATADLREELLKVPEAAETAASGLAVFTTPFQRSTTGGQAVFFENLASNAELAADKVAATADAVSTAIDSLNQRRTDRINEQIASVTTELQGARDAAAQAIEGITQLLSGDLFDTGQKLLDEALLSIPETGRALSEAIAGVAATEGAPGTPGIPLAELFRTGDASTSGGAQLRNIFGGFSQTIQSIVNDAILNGARTAADRELALAPLAAAVRSLDVPDPIKQVMLDEINRFIENEGLDAAIQRLVIAEEAVTELDRQLQDLNAKLPVSVEFNPFQVAQELRRLQALGLYSGVIPSSAEIAAAQQAAQAQALIAGGTTPVGRLAADQIINGPAVNVEEMNFYETANSRQTAAEATRAFTAAAAAGSFAAVFTPGGP